MVDAIATGKRQPLVDRFGRKHTYLRVSATDRCNFRCVYCMPAEGIAWREREEILTFEEILRIVKLLAEMGVDKVRLTGGEPTVRKNIERLIEGIASVDGIRDLLMTTNGFRLPEMAGIYRNAGLTGLNISLDSLKPDRFERITRTKNFDKVMAGIAKALELGFSSLKINCVVMAGVNDDEMLDFVEFARENPVNVRFIEYMPFEGNGWTKGGLFSYRKMRSAIEKRHPLVPLPTPHTAVAKDFCVAGFAGTVSFITSMTESFCSGCNRIRLTADGNLKPCLFGPQEVSLRDPMRAGAADEELEKIIRAALMKKDFGHAPAELIRVGENRPMVSIGG